jgi:UDP-glucose 4-epimerase
MARAMRASRCTALAHLAFFASRVLDRSYAHEVESFGTTNALAASHDAGLQTLLMTSTTTVYGASPRNPNLLTEQRPLAGASAGRFVADRIEAERQVRRFAEANPATRAVVLRLAPVVGPSVDTPFTRFLGNWVVPAVLGHDPLVQCLHEDDVGEAAERALFGTGSGAYNVVGRGVLPISVATRLAGAVQVPLPEPVASLTLETLDALGLSAMPAGLLGYLRHLWVADGTRAERELGFKPRFSTREAIVSFANSRRSKRI